LRGDDPRQAGAAFIGPILEVLARCGWKLRQRSVCRIASIDCGSTCYNVAGLWYAAAMKPTMKPTSRDAMLRVRIRDTERDALQAIATREDEPLSATVRRALRFYIEHTEGTKAGHGREGRA
jgi:hypothetical protein